MTVVSGVFLLLSFILPRVGIDRAVKLAWVSVVISGIPLLYLALWRVIYNHGISKISSALLIVTAMLASIAIGDLFAAGEVAFIMAIGAILEDMTTERAKKGLKKLISLTPTEGRRIEEGREIMISADEILPGDILRILPGETIPVDGVIIKGETSVDQAIMTGESLPVDKGIGDDVFCGTINRFGSIDIKASKVGEDSSLQKLIRMVEEAEEKQAPMQRIADKSASYLVPAALFIAVISGLITKDIIRAVTVLVVFCSCALVLATPTAIMAAIGQATKHGVIIKSGEALEKMGHVDAIAFDKTGTLTYGTLEVSDILSFNEDWDKSRLLSFAASAEKRSEHPLGKAIAAYAEEKEIPLMEAHNFRMSAGRGVYAEVDKHMLFCGNGRYMSENGILVEEGVRAKEKKLHGEGKACVLVAEGRKCVGIIALSDVLRRDAKSVISCLNAMNVKAVLLTGDNQKAADYFAYQIGIKEVHAELLPEEKVESIERLRKENRMVCMIGDGVNDAPALKTADVGVAMGSMGSDIAVDAADIALMSDDISKLPYLKKLANAAVKTIKLSITLSMCINLIAVTLSVMGKLTPTTGALVHNAGSCFVILIAALLYDRKFE